MSDLVKFKKGQSANLSSTAITPGQILVSTDTGEMHVDYDDNGTSKRVKIKDPSVATNYVSKSGDTMTGTLYIDVTNSSLPNMVSTDTYVRGLLGAKLSNSLSIPLIYCASQNNDNSGVGVSFTGKGLTIIGAGENGPSAILNNAAQKSGTTNGSNGNAMTPTTEELVLSSDTVISFYPGAKTDSYASQINSSGTFIGPTADAATIQSSLVTGTYLQGNQGVALVNSTATAGSYVTLLKSNSTNGYFTVANHGANFKLQYTAKTTVDSNTNSVTKSVTLLDESGNTSFAGTVTVGTPTANTHAATKAYVDSHTTTYTFTNGLSASGTTVSNSGVRSVATGTSNGTISVNTNGTAANVAVKGLGTAAYTAATNYVAKAGDTMTGALYVDVTQTSLPNSTSYTDVRGIFGVRLSDSLTLPIIHAAGDNNTSAGAGLAVTGGGLTIIGGGENTPLGILHNAIAGSGTNGAAGTALNPRVEEIALASDSGISIFTGGTTASPNAYIDNNGTYHGAIELAGARGLTTSIANGVTTIKKKWTKNLVNADTGVWQKIADGSLTGNSDINILFEVVDTLTHSHGILRLGCRVSNINGVANTAITDTSNAQGPRLSWLCRDKELNPEHFRLKYVQMNSNGTYTRGLWELQFYHHRKNYATVFTVLTEEGNNDNLPEYTLYTGATASDISSGTTVVVSTDVIPIGGTWNSSTHCTENAKGITIGEYGKCTTSTSGNIAIGGTGSRSTSATGSWAIAVGSGANSSGDNSLAVGNTVTASNTAATAVGYNNTASGSHATAVGSTNTAVGVALGYGNTASNSYTSAVGISNTASSVGSTAFGRSNTVSGENSYAIGGWNTLAGEKCFAIGSDNNLDSVAGNGGLRYMHRSGAIGCNNTLQCNTTSGSNTYDYVYAIGGYNKMRNTGIAIGCNNTINITATSEEARRDFSVAIGGFNSCTQYNSYALGYALQNNSNGAFVCGRQNKALTANTTYTASSTGDVFAVGNGYSQPDSSSPTGYKHVRSNAFRVTYAGAVYARAAYNASGADYAEFIKEWWDGNPNNEDRVGYMVTVKNGKLYKANEGDYIIGITSGNPSVIGNADEDYFWMYERDEFNRIISEEVPDIKPKIDENGEFILDEDGKIIYEDSGNTIKRFKFREEYDPSLQDSYIERKDRPEWDYVGMRGIVPCRDDGTCEEGRFCKCGSDGIATKADTRGFDTYYVVERINDHVISVEVK